MAFNQKNKERFALLTIILIFSGIIAAASDQYILATKKVNLESSLASNENNRNHKPLLMMADYEGINQPSVFDAEKVIVDGDSPVVGVEINGQPYAFVLSAMASPSTHVVNMLVDGNAISVTYCDLVNCVRVLTKATQPSEIPKPLPLKVGGLDVSNQMVFKYENRLYGQSSPYLPLEDFPFSRMTFSKWKSLHPNTLVYVDQTQVIKS